MKVDDLRALIRERNIYLIKGKYLKKNYIELLEKNDTEQTALIVSKGKCIDSEYNNLCDNGGICDLLHGVCYNRNIQGRPYNEDKIKAMDEYKNDYKFDILNRVLGTEYEVNKYLKERREFYKNQRISLLNMNLYQLECEMIYRDIEIPELLKLSISEKKEIYITMLTDYYTTNIDLDLPLRYIADDTFVNIIVQMKKLNLCGNEYDNILLADRKYITGKLWRQLEYRNINIDIIIKKAECDDIEGEKCPDNKVCSSFTHKCISDSGNMSKLTTADGRVIIGNNQSLSSLQGLLGGTIQKFDRVDRVYNLLKLDINKNNENKKVPENEYEEDEEEKNVVKQEYTIESKPEIININPELVKNNMKIWNILMDDLKKV